MAARSALALVVDDASRLGLPRVAARPQQLRAQIVLDKLVGATRALLEEKDFENISVADIAQRARVSVGIFYQRFATREHVLAHIARDLAAQLQMQVEKELGSGNPRRLGLSESVDSYFNIVATNFVRHRAVLRPLSLTVRATTHAELRQITSAFNERVHTIIRDRLLEHASMIRHASAETAIDFAIFVASATLREKFLYGEPVSRLTTRHRDVVRETARLCVSYLVTDSHNKSRGRHG